MWRILALGAWLAAPGAYAQEPIEPISAATSINTAKANLGKQLFFDTRLSIDSTISCASCHDLKDGFGTDLKRVSTGVGGKLGRRNAPTVFNSSLSFKQMWDGRATDLAEQASFPVIDPKEMGYRSWTEAAEKIGSLRDYTAAFQAVFGKPADADSIQDSLAEFQRTLTTPDAPFDRYLKGDESAISAQQIRGYGFFKSYGCSACHQGANVGGNMFQRFGVLKDINLRAPGSVVDLGRFEVTKNEWDKHVFKVPSLRLAVKTPPYFHDGSAKTIQDAVDIMIEFQLGRTVATDHRDDIIAFLDSLVGTIPEVSQ